jgi:hypothetical protein
MTHEEEYKGQRNTDQQQHIELVIKNDVHDKEQESSNMSDIHHELQYKSKYFPFCYSPYYFCCCDYLPHKILNYSKVDIPDHIIGNSDSGASDVLSRDFNEHVIRNILLPYYDTRLKYIMNTQICWSRVGNVAYTTSSILVGIASVLSFASGTYPSIHLNFIAGSLGLLALVCKEFAAYSNTLDHAKVSSVNKLLKQLKIDHELSDTSLDMSSVFSSSLNNGKKSI